MEAVLNGGSWTFDNNMMILEQVQLGVQIDQIPLFHATMWVQVYNLPTGLMKENVGIRLANFIGTFVEYDKNNNSSFWRQYMRIRVRVDVRQPLKKETKVKNREGEWCIVKFKYEKLGIFCFLCGIMGHAENKCELRYAMEQDDGRREWSAEIRADTRRQGGRQVSRWLREERGGRDDSGDEGMEFPSNSHVGNQNRGPTSGDVAAHGPIVFQNQSQPANQPALMTRQGTLLPNNSVQPQSPNGPIINIPAHNSSNDSTNHYDLPIQQLFANPNLNSLSKPQPVIPSLKINAPDNTINSLYPTFIGNHKTNPFITQPMSNSNGTQLLPNDSLVFTTQPTNKDPPRLLLTNNKKTRGIPKPSKSVRTKPVYQPEPKIEQP
jgi:14-3-3 protein epsilon